MEMPYQPIGDRARLARRLLMVAVVVDVLSVAAGLLERSVLGHLAAGEQPAEDLASFSDTGRVVAEALKSLLLAVNAVTFVRWLSLAYRNLPALGVRRLRYNSWWAIGGWFIPILNAFRPKEIINDVWRGSDPAASPRQGLDWVERPVPGLLSGWWAAWLVSTGLGNSAALSSFRTGNDLADPQWLNGVYLLADVLSVVAGLLAIRVVARVTARQEERARLLADPSMAASGSGQ